MDGRQQQQQQHGLPIVALRKRRCDDVPVNNYNHNGNHVSIVVANDDGENDHDVPSTMKKKVAMITTTLTKTMTTNGGTTTTRRRRSNGGDGCTSPSGHKNSCRHHVDDSDGEEEGTDRDNITRPRSWHCRRDMHVERKKSCFGCFILVLVGTTLLASTTMNELFYNIHSSRRTVVTATTTAASSTSMGSDGSRTASKITIDATKQFQQHHSDEEQQFLDNNKQRKDGKENIPSSSISLSSNSLFLDSFLQGISHQGNHGNNDDDVGDGGICGSRKCFFSTIVTSSSSVSSGERIPTTTSSTANNNDDDELNHVGYLIPKSIMRRYSVSSTCNKLHNGYKLGMELQQLFPQISTHLYQLGPPIIVETKDKEREEAAAATTAIAEIMTTDHDDGTSIRHITTNATTYQYIVDTLNTNLRIQVQQPNNKNKTKKKPNGDANKKDDVKFYTVDESICIQPMFLAPTPHTIVSCTATRQESVKVSSLHDFVSQHVVGKPTTSPPPPPSASTTLLTSFYQTLERNIDVVKNMTQYSNNKYECILRDFQFVLDKYGNLYHLDLDRCFVSGSNELQTRQTNNKKKKKVDLDFPSYNDCFSNLEEQMLRIKEGYSTVL